jgi:hypothetical protein
MKKILMMAVVAFIGMSGINAQADAIDRFFEQYQEDENFTMVYVSPKMFQLVAKVASEELDEDLNDVVKNLKSLKVLRTEVNAQQVYKDANKKIDTKDYELLLTARDKGQNVNFFTKTTGNNDVVEELLLLVGGEKEFVLLSFVGTLDLQKIAKLAKKMDIDGAEHLQKLEKN